MFDSSDPFWGGGPQGGLTPPTRRDLEALAASALAHVSPDAQRMIAGLALLVRETPDDETMLELGVASPFELLGRFDETTGSPRMTLYRRPILDYWAERGAPLSEIIFEIILAELDAIAAEEQDRRDAGATANGDEADDDYSLLR